MAHRNSQKTTLENVALLEHGRGNEEADPEEANDETQMTLLDLSLLSHKEEVALAGSEVEALPAVGTNDFHIMEDEMEGGDEATCLVQQPMKDEPKQDESQASTGNTTPSTLQSQHTTYSPEILTTKDLPTVPDTNIKAADTARDEERTGTDKGKLHSKTKEKPSVLAIPGKKKKHKERRRDKKETSFDVNSPTGLTPKSPTSPLSEKGSKKVKAITVAVFVKEGSAKLLVLENGKLTTAGEIKKMMMDNLSLCSIASTVFAIWLVSPLLELQLKDHHIPFTLRKQWPDLLRKFAMVSDEVVIENDEPVLVFQRNTFLSLEVEKRITDQKILQTLYEEAKSNVLKGKYPIPNSDGEMLGGFVARLENGKFDPDSHKIGFFKNSLPHYLPQSCRGKWFTRSVSVEQKLLDQYSKASDRCDDPIKLHRLFLEYCWNLPFYGCTFFKGKVEHESKVNDYWPWKAGVMNIYVGVSRQGITIFKENRREILLSLNYDELSWDFVASQQPGVLDSFCIEFDTTDEDGRRLAKQLEIFSSQAVMMDAMVDSCVCEMNRLKIPKSPATSPEDGTRPLADEGPSFLKRDRKSNFSLSSPFKFTTYSSH